MKKIWIDLDNSPHVLFFNPIIKELQKKGYRVVITARDYAQVIGLADLFNLEYLRVGHHFGKNKYLKIIGVLYRSLQLFPIIAKETPDLAFSHGSRSQAISARIARIPTIVAFDYEYTQPLPFIMRPDLTIVPEILVQKGLNRKIKKVVGYPGIKEDVYVQDVIPDASIYRLLGINEEKILVTVRPPATTAHYRTPKSDVLFQGVTEYLMSKPDCQVIILPRTKDQGVLIKSTWPNYFDEDKMVIPNQVVNGLNLIWHSDLVISGGGTIIREAAALGVPAYSIFGGKIGAVDEYLSGSGRLTLVRSVEDVKRKIIIKKRTRPDMHENGNSLTMQKIVDEVIAFANA